MLLALGRPLWRVRLPRRRRRRSARLRRYSSLAASPPSPRPRPDEESNWNRRGSGRGQRGGGVRAGDWCGTHGPTACMGLCIGVYSAAAALCRLWAAPRSTPRCCPRTAGLNGPSDVGRKAQQNYGSARVGMFMRRGEQTRRGVFLFDLCPRTQTYDVGSRPSGTGRSYRSGNSYQILPRLDARVHNT